MGKDIFVLLLFRSGRLYQSVTNLSTRLVPFDIAKPHGWLWLLATKHHTNYQGGRLSSPTYDLSNYPTKSSHELSDVKLVVNYPIFSISTKGRTHEATLLFP